MNTHDEQQVNTDETTAATGRHRRRAHERDARSTQLGGAARAADSLPVPGDGRMFTLDRAEDVTGMSGAGAVAEGATFFDGTVAVRWAGTDASTVVWPDLDTAMRVHGHAGRTRVVWHPNVEHFAKSENGPALEVLVTLLEQAGEHARAVMPGDLGHRLGVALEALAQQPGRGLLPYRLRRLAEALLAVPIDDKGPR